MEACLPRFWRIVYLFFSPFIYCSNNNNLCQTFCCCCDVSFLFDLIVSVQTFFQRHMATEYASSGLASPDIGYCIWRKYPQPADITVAAIAHVEDNAALLAPSKSTLDSAGGDSSDDNFVRGTRVTFVCGMRSGAVCVWKYEQVPPTLGTAVPDRWCPDSVACGHDASVVSLEMLEMFGGDMEDVVLSVHADGVVQIISTKDGMLLQRHRLPLPLRRSRASLIKSNVYRSGSLLPRLRRALQWRFTSDRRRRRLSSSKGRPRASILFSVAMGRACLYFLCSRFATSRIYRATQSGLLVSKY